MQRQSSSSMLNLPRERRRISALTCSSAINNWETAGKKNTNVTLSLADTQTINQLDTGDLANSPGLVNLPVCTFYEAGLEFSENGKNAVSRSTCARCHSAHTLPFSCAFANAFMIRLCRLVIRTGRVHPVPAEPKPALAE